MAPASASSASRSSASPSLFPHIHCCVCYRDFVPRDRATTALEGSQGQLRVRADDFYITSVEPAALYAKLLASRRCFSTIGIYLKAQVLKQKKVLNEVKAELVAARELKHAYAALQRENNELRAKLEFKEVASTGVFNEPLEIESAQPSRTMTIRGSIPPAISTKGASIEDSTLDRSEMIRGRSAVARDGERVSRPSSRLSQFAYSPPTSHSKGSDQLGVLHGGVGEGFRLEPAPVSSDMGPPTMSRREYAERIERSGSTFKFVDDDHLRTYQAHPAIGSAPSSDPNEAKRRKLTTTSSSPAGGPFALDRDYGTMVTATSGMMPISSSPMHRRMSTNPETGQFMPNRSLGAGRPYSSNPHSARSNLAPFQSPFLNKK
ncbi:hypothetical protein IE53DRAFT_368746 [Violaceomyces palustris]|uniref:Uncharacterized protein n=1 Tax=Violaceomyces palustris TaxID=1673888 RepID=A0ACD0NY12_9BASI|nr:hypothetical protein IE53DRAFT_368746 [Violaceomyces palustris]